MIEKKPQNISLNRCKFCGWKIPNDLVEKLCENSDPLFCELCGAEIKYERVENQENHELIKTKSEIELRISSDKLKSPLWKRFYETIKKFILENEEGEFQERLTKKQNKYITRVYKDPDFPQIFKSNFIIVFARITYFELNKLQSTANLKNSKRNLTKVELKTLTERLNPIAKKDIKAEFLKDLHKISQNDFRKWLIKLQVKLESSPTYYHDFITYIQWLITIIAKIVSELWDKTNLPKFEQTILEDLKNYFYTKNNIKNDPEESELFEKFLQYTHKIELIKDLINEFNKFGCWIKSLRPTKTFINFMKKKRNLLENVSQNNSSNTIKNQVEILSTYITLIMKIRDNDILTRAIRNLILENKGKFNAYDIQKWLLISDTSARNQLKRMFPKEQYQKYIRTQKYITIKTIEEIAEKKGGKCHTKNIKNAKSKIHLECAEGHHFDTTYNSVVYSNTWCPDCHIYVSETICRQFFKRIFKRPFPKSYPPWLVNEKGNQMELDGYNKELGLAFEYQGIQHRKKIFNMTNEDLQNIKNEDALKLKLCQEKNVILIQIPDDEIVPYDEIQDYIIQEYERKTGKALENIPKYDYKEFTIYENKYAKKFRAYVEKKGGTLLTPYFSAKKEVTLMCEKGHQWTTTPDSIYKDNWCSECAGNTKGTTEEFRKIGKKFNCDLLNEYVNAKTPLRYICQKGHKFKRTPYWLKRTYEEITGICPKCQMEIFAEKFQQIVSDKGGYLLTPYKGRFKPIKIKCENNHEWNTTPAVVYQGSWCKICADKNHPNRTRQKTAKLEFYEMVKSLKYTLFSDYENNTKKVYMQCQNQHEFTMTPKYFKRLVNQKVEPCSKCRKNK